MDLMITVHAGLLFLVFLFLVFVIFGVGYYVGGGGKR